MLVIAGITAFAVGIMCFTDAELMWSLYEADTRMWSGRTTVRPRNWKAWVHWAGVTLTLLGALAIVVGLSTF